MLDSQNMVQEKTHGYAKAALAQRAKKKKYFMYFLPFFLFSSFLQLPGRAEAETSLPKCVNGSFQTIYLNYGESKEIAELLSQIMFQPSMDSNAPCGTALYR